MNSSTEINQPQPRQVTIPVKIQCECGQKYAFEVEPIGRFVNYTVQCPVCGADGTEAANRVVAHHLATQNAFAPAPRFGVQINPPGVRPSLPRNAGGAIQSKNSTGNQVGSNRLVAAIGGVVVLVMVLAGTVLGLRHGRPLERINSADLVQSTFPRTLKELDTSYVEPPAGQNAATFYSKGFDELQVVNAGSSNLPLLGKGTLPPLGTAMPGPMKSGLSALMQANKNALLSFAQGAGFEQSRYAVDLSSGFETAFPHLSKFRSAALVVELSAILHAENHDGKQAANDVRTALALGRSLEMEPALISQLVRAAAVRKAVEAWERTVNRTSLPRESLAELLGIFQTMEDYEAQGQGFNHGLVAERATWTVMLGTPQKLVELVSAGVLDIPAEQRDSIITQLQNGGNVREERKSIDKAFQRLMATRKETFPDRLNAEDVIRQSVSEADQKRLMVLRVLSPGLVGATVKEAECLAALRLGLTAVALEQFRAINDNRYPATLSALTPQYLPATLTDPFDGQPLRYRTKGAGYLLYSVGPDLKDNSGERVGAKERDITFAVVAPPRGTE